MKELEITSGFLLLNQVGYSVVAIRPSAIIAIYPHSDSSTIKLIDGSMISVKEYGEEILATIGVDNEKTAKV